MAQRTSTSNTYLRTVLHPWSLLYGTQVVKSVITLLYWTKPWKQGFPCDEALHWQNLKEGGGGGGGLGWSMPWPWHNNTPTGPTVDTDEGKHACQRAREHRQTWWMAQSSHEATRIQTGLAERGRWCVVSPLLSIAIQRIPFTHRTDPSMSHHYLSQQWHCNTIWACTWPCECVHTSAPCMPFCALAQDFAAFSSSVCERSFRNHMSKWVNAARLKTRDCKICFCRCARASMRVCKCEYICTRVCQGVCVSRPLGEISERGHDLASTAGLSVCLVGVTIAMVLCRQDVYVGDLKVITSLLL